MPEATYQLSDKALSVFVFAAYHDLLGGEKVVSIARTDGKGRGADPEGVAELEARELIEKKGNFIHFNPEGRKFLETVIGAIRREVDR